MATAKKLVIFGSGDVAQLARYYFETDTDYSPVAFTVDAAHRTGASFDDRPLVDFETLDETFPPAEHAFFAAIAYGDLNRLRRRKVNAAKAKGYTIASYVSSRCTYLAQTPPGENAFILEDNTIQPFVRIGSNVTLWSGNHIGHHSTIEDDVFVSSHVVVSGGVRVGRGCFLGVNATLRDHITLGDRCVVAAGALVTKSFGEERVLKGAPAKADAQPASALAGI